MNEFPDQLASVYRSDQLFGCGHVGLVAKGARDNAMPAGSLALQRLVKLLQLPSVSLQHSLHIHTRDLSSALRLTVKLSRPPCWSCCEIKMAMAREEGGGHLQERERALCKHNTPCNLQNVLV